MGILYNIISYNTAKSCVRFAIAIHPLLTERIVAWPQTAPGHTPNLLLDPPLSSSFALATDTETARLGKAQCATGS